MNTASALKESAGRRRALRSRRRGMALYVAVFGTATVVAITTLAALSTARIQTMAMDGKQDRAEAESLAKAALIQAQAYLDSKTVGTNTQWRSLLTSGVASVPVAFGRGTIRWMVIDEADGNLNNNQTDPVRIYGIGQVGITTRVCSVLAECKSPLTCLNAAVVAGGPLNLDTSTVTAAGMTIATNANAIGNGANVTANIEAVGSITGPISGSGSKTTGVPARTMPASNVFNPYIAAGTAIPYTLLTPYSGGGRAIEKKAMGPMVNPFNVFSPNPKGIYVIDCQNQKITIVNSRIVGTLVILNPGSGSSIGDNTTGGHLNWVPSIPNYPCLLVDGNMQLSFGYNASSVLSESSLFASFNMLLPFPYPFGAMNPFLTDNFPNRISGLIYVSGNATGSNSGWWTRIDMLVVGGSYNIMNDRIYPVYSSTYYNDPPPGFVNGGRVVANPETWQWTNLP